MLNIKCSLERPAEYLPLDPTSEGCCRCLHLAPIEQDSGVFRRQNNGRGEKNKSQYLVQHKQTIKAYLNCNQRIFFSLQLTMDITFQNKRKHEVTNTQAVYKRKTKHTNSV